MSTDKKLDKIVVSRFEFAIMESVKLPNIEKYRPITADEERAARKQKTDEFFSNIKKATNVTE